MHVRVSLFVAGLTVRPNFVGLGSILPVIVGTGLALSCEHPHAHKEEERFICDYSASSSRLFLCILKHIYIIGDTLYFEVI